MKGILTDNHAAANVEAGKVGKPYQPANGTEGDIFVAAFCGRCAKDRGDGCCIMMASMIFEPGDAAYPPEWCYDGSGQPTCTAFEDLTAAA